jgi:WD40 repeat protein
MAIGCWWRSRRRSLESNGISVTVLHGHSDSVVSAAFSPDGTRIVTASWDKTARIWDVATGEEITAIGRAHQTVEQRSPIS